MIKHRQVTTAQLDQLRAGLLDDDPELKARIQAALRSDPRLARQYGRWDVVREQLERSREAATRLNNRLRLRRRSVLAGKSKRKPRRFTLPQMALATVASMAFTLVVALWFNSRPEQQTVSITDNSDVGTSLTAAIDVDLKDNVDFYVWMQGQSDLQIEMPRKGT